MSPRASRLRSLRFRLPFLLLLYCGAVGTAIYLIVDRTQERRFEQEFQDQQVTRATELLERTERAAERSELDTAQREFGEMAANQALRAAVFVGPDNRVLLTSRRQWRNRIIDLAALGLPGADRPRVEDAMRQTHQSRHTHSLLINDRDGLVLILPASLPLVRGALDVDRSALIVLVYDLSLAKAINAYRLRQLFLLIAGAVVLAVVILGIALHFFVTLRLERIQELIGRFAAGESIDGPHSRVSDEIGVIGDRFQQMAQTVRREMSERLEADAALRETEGKFRTAMRYSPIGHALMGPDGRFVEVNPALCEILGYSEEELAQRSFTELTHPDDIAESLELNRRMRIGEIESFEIEKRYFHKAGHAVWTQLNAAVVRREGKPAYFVTQTQDITQRKFAEDRITRANRALRAISHCNQVLVHATDENSLLTQICRVIVEDGGYRLAWVAFARSQNVIAAAQWGEDNGYIASSLEVWQRQVTAPGALRDFLLKGETRVTHDFATDPFVTEWRDAALSRGLRSSATFALKEDDRTFGALMIYSDQPDAFDAHEMTLLSEMAEDLAYGIQALRTRTRRERAEEELRESQGKLLAAMQSMSALNERYAKHEAAMAMLTRCHVQSPEQLSEVLRSITEIVAEAIDVGRVSVWRRRGPSTFSCDDAFEREGNQHLSGMEVNGALVDAYARTLTESDLIAASDAFRDPRTAAFAEAYFVDYGIRAVLDIPIRVQGSMLAVLRFAHLHDERKWTPDEQTFAVAVANLLSSLYAQVERLRLEGQLRQATKLEGIGQLAGGVAHDFNNVLTVILGKAGQLADDPRLPPELREAADDITQSGDRAANLTRQLLAFSRRQAMQVRDHDLNAVIRNVARLLDRLLGEDLDLELVIAEEPIYVRADAGMIDQVLLNLAVNARDAMRDGGRLVVTTSLVQLDALVTSRVSRPSGPYACLNVSDTGSGIPAENLPHIFEPFFTTKDVGKGTGLGLATTYGIVQQHHGWIEVDSEVGRGTTFSIYLPSFTQPAIVAVPVELAPAKAPVASSSSGRETILVVEDEEEVRSLIVEALTGFGYRVWEAPSGPVALEVWREHGATIDLMITDMVMPGGMNGLELASHLRRENPALRIIYISGYLADVSREDLSQSEGAAYLAKPFNLPTLARLVRQSLDAVPQTKS